MRKSAGQIGHGAFKADDGFIGLGKAEFLAGEAANGIGVVAEGFDFGEQALGEFFLFDLVGLEAVDLAAHAFVLVDERQVGQANEHQDGHRDERDDCLGELAPDAEIHFFFHARSKSCAGKRCERILKNCAVWVGAGIDLVVSGGGDAVNLRRMLKVFFLIFEPGVAWEKIAQAKRGYAFILGTYLLPMILLVTAVEGWSLHQHGKWQPDFHKFKMFTLAEIKGFEVMQAGLLLAMVFVAALVLHAANNNFQGRRTFQQVFTVVAYSFSPWFLCKLLDAVPMMNPAVTWGVGVGLMVWVLYQGVPRVMCADPTHAFGQYLSAIIILALTSGLVQLVAAMFLQGRIDHRNAWVTKAIVKFFE